ncbi:MAG: serine/threonine protein kinase [Polyangiaceae bacterium]|nr:serine/threonine protein kinase [Polyangiaceae bacterium]
MANEQQSSGLSAGARLLGRFELRKVIGEGGMGVVWAATDLVTTRPVALKFHKTEGKADERNQARFMREAQSAMSVRHPNVAPVHAVLSTPEGVPFLVMDLLSGESLRQRLERPPALTVPEVLRIMTRVCAAVEAAHTLQIIHRDLKPENIFLARSDVQVLDFGIAKRLPRSGFGDAETALTSAGAFLGTPCYMAPEQIYGEELDERADVWSLGIVLYECLSGVLPTAGGLGHTLKIITRDGVKPLREVAPQVPAPLCDIVMQMLSLKPDQRPTVAQVRQVLEGARPAYPSGSSPGNSRVAIGRSVAAPPLASARRSSSLTGVLIALGALSLVLVGVLLYQTQGRSADPVATSEPSVPPVRTAPSGPAPVVLAPSASNEGVPLLVAPPSLPVELDGRTLNFTAGSMTPNGMSNHKAVIATLNRLMQTLKECLSPKAEAGVMWSLGGSLIWKADQELNVVVVRQREGAIDTTPEGEELAKCVRNKIKSWPMPTIEFSDNEKPASVHFWAGYAAMPARAPSP